MVRDKQSFIQEFGVKGVEKSAKKTLKNVSKTYPKKFFGASRKMVSHNN